MNSRERVARAIGFSRPDRPPISHAILPSAQYHYGKRLAEITDAVPEDFGWRFLPDLPRHMLPPLYRKGINTDEFGTVWKVTVEGRCGIPIGYPIPEDWSGFDEFSVPPVFRAGPPKYRLYSGHMAGDSGDYYARGGWITLFEQIQQLHGFEPTLVDITMGRREVYRLRDDLLAFNLRWIESWLKGGYQGLHFADDWGSQRNLLIEPIVWREFFKPCYAEMFRQVKEAGLDVWFHSDGYILDIIEDLIEMGVDVLNCQVAVIGQENLSRFAGKICFRTDIDRQSILPFVSPPEVKEYVQSIFCDLGTSEGGIIACGEISEDVPLDNIRAMYEAFMEFRH